VNEINTKPKYIVHFKGPKRKVVAMEGDARQDLNLKFQGSKYQKYNI
jgi:hypothetical protein